MERLRDLNPYNFTHLLIEFIEYRIKDLKQKIKGLLQMNLEYISVYLLSKTTLKYIF